MAFNPSPQVADCRDVAHKWNCDIVVILGFNTKEGKFQTASYGETKPLCDIGKQISEKVFAQIEKGELP